MSTKNMLPRLRSRKGLHIVEFGAVLFIVIAAMMLPLVSVCVIAGRLALAQFSADQTVARLARSESFSAACKLAQRLDSNEGQDIQLAFTHPQVSLCVSNYGDGKSIEVSQPRAIPAGWLPGETQRNYSLHLRGDLHVEPLLGRLSLLDLKLPGVNSPVNVKIHSVAAWENFGRNPITQQFYINE